MPKFLCIYVDTITLVNRYLFIAISWVVFLIASVMVVEVISRYLFNSPTTWGMELATLLFGPYFLLGGPYLLHLKGHVNLDLIQASMSEKNRLRMEIANQIVIILFCAILLYYSFPLAFQSFEYKETSFSAWNPQIWPAKLTVPLAVLLLGGQGVAELVKLFFPTLSKSDLPV
jgi:TRAP-type mannitol/chloroaromatic compound transport system permease small subunit